MDVLAWEIRQAWRRLASTPALSTGAVLILALGIGSAVVMADVLDRLLLRAPAGVADPDRVARLYVGTGRGFFDITGYDAGLALAWAGGRALSSQLFGVGAHDPRVLAAAAASVLLVGALAAWLPARRAARIEPTVALRLE